MIVFDKKYMSIFFSLQQQMPMGQYGNQYPPGMSQRHPGPMNMGPGPGAGPGPMMRNPMYTRRQAPYHNPHNPNMGKRPSFPNGPQVGATYYVLSLGPTTKKVGFFVCFFFKLNLILLDGSVSLFPTTFFKKIQKHLNHLCLSSYFMMFFF